MTYIIFIIKSAVDDFRRNKVRTFLTSLGILIGVSSVVLLNAFGLGLKQYIKSQFESLGSNLIFVVPGQVLQSGSANRPGGGALGGAEFDERDVNSLKRIENIDYIVPVFTKTVYAESNDKTELVSILASTADFFVLLNLENEFGDLYAKSDVDKRAKIVVIGPKLAEKLYSDKESALDKFIKINNQRYRIVGITKSKGGGGLAGPDFDSYVYMPYKSAYSFNPKKIFITVYLKAVDDKSIPQIKKDVKELLLKRYNEGDFSILEQTEILNTVNSIFGVLNMILVMIGAISLIVGGIGIMNIMYVSVVERTREVGIRRSIGATRSDILLQFLSEAVILSLIGGSAGIIVSYLATLVVQRVFPAYIDINSVLIALTVSSAIGIVFGVFPARKAANLTPVEAIRYE